MDVEKRIHKGHNNGSEENGRIDRTANLNKLVGDQIMVCMIRVEDLGLMHEEDTYIKTK